MEASIVVNQGHTLTHLEARGYIVSSGLVLLLITQSVCVKQLAEEKRAVHIGRHLHLHRTRNAGQNICSHHVRHQSLYLLSIGEGIE